MSRGGVVSGPLPSPAGESLPRTARRTGATGSDNRPRGRKSYRLMQHRSDLLGRRGRLHRHPFSGRTLRSLGVRPLSLVPSTSIWTRQRVPRLRKPWHGSLRRATPKQIRGLSSWQAPTCLFELPCNRPPTGSRKALGKYPGPCLLSVQGTHVLAWLRGWPTGRHEASARHGPLGRVGEGPRRASGPRRRSAPRPRAGRPGGARRPGRRRPRAGRPGGAFHKSHYPPAS